MLRKKQLYQWLNDFCSNLEKNGLFISNMYYGEIEPWQLAHWQLSNAATTKKEKKYFILKISYYQLRWQRVVITNFFQKVKRKNSS